MQMMLGGGGTFGGIRRHIDELIVRGPPRYYFPEPTKSILVVSPRNAPQAEAFFRGYRLQIVTGSRYLKSFVGSKASQNFWLGLLELNSVDVHDHSMDSTPH